MLRSDLNFFFEIKSADPAADVLLLAVSATSSRICRYPARRYSASAAGCNSDVLNSSRRAPNRRHSASTETQHFAGDSATPRRWIDVHPAQLHRVRRRAFQAEHAGQRYAAPLSKAAVMFAVIGGDPPHLLGQRAGDVRLERSMAAGWRQLPVHQDEQIPDRCKYGPETDG